MLGFVFFVGIVSDLCRSLNPRNSSRNVMSRNPQGKALGSRYRHLLMAKNVFQSRPTPAYPSGLGMYLAT